MLDRITKTDSVTETDSGLFVLVMLLRLLGIGADSEQIRHRFGGARIGIPEILRCAKEFGLKARERIAGWKRLETTPMPAIAVLRDGGFLLLGKFADGKVVVLSPHSQRPAVMTKAEFEAVSDGRVGAPHWPTCRGASTSPGFSALFTSIVAILAKYSLPPFSCS